MTLKESMELAGRNLLGILSPDHGSLPYFGVEPVRDGSVRCQMYWPSHNVGRWWDALLRLEAATGFAIPPASDLHTLCDIYTHVIEESAAGLQVNFHFDYEDARIRIRSERGTAARLEIRLPTPEPLRVRIPRWVPEESVRLEVNGKTLPPAFTAGFLTVPGQRGPADIRVEHALPAEKVVERTDGVDYEVSWRGDEIVGIAPNSDWLPFYPSVPAQP